MLQSETRGDESGGARRERRIDVANNIQTHKAYTMRVAASRAIHTRTTHAQSDIDDASGEDSETGDERGKKWYNTAGLDSKFEEGASNAGHLQLD